MKALKKLFQRQIVIHIDKLIGQMDIVPLEDRANIESDIAEEFKKAIEPIIGHVDNKICHQEKSLEDVIVDVTNKTDLHKELSNLESKIPEDIEKCRISLRIYWARPRYFTFKAGS